MRAMCWMNRWVYSLAMWYHGTTERELIVYTLISLVLQTVVAQ